MINIVLGAMFGDEGKGSMVNHLARQGRDFGRKTLVVRFSGGPQAGHTVVQDGVRHVFSHVGSGTLSGADTLWSKYCLFEPGAFMTEVQSLRNKGFKPNIYIDNECQVITPYDRFLNQIDADNLGHGSCGQGIGKTQARKENSPISLTVGDLYAPKWVLDHKIDQVRKFYFGESNPPEIIEKEIIMFRKFIDQFIINFPDGEYPLYEYHDYIFEGSQGILLDREVGLFPHVTYANTTSKNAWDLIKEWDLDGDVRIFYVTRSYLTRHGTGPMGGFETKDLFLKNNTEETNVVNKYQGEFRLAPFDWKLFNWAVQQDKPVEGDKYLVITCMDQHPDKIPVRMTELSVVYLEHKDFRELFPEDTLFSYGPEFKLQ